MKPWVTFAGFVLVVFVLYWAQPVLVPIALAVLLTFVLTPPVTWLERWIGRVAAVLAMVALVFTALGLASWGLARRPSAPSKTRYFVKRLRAALPDLRILVGRLGPPELADESTQVLRHTRANLVASTLIETRTYLGGLVEIPRISGPEATGSAA